MNDISDSVPVSVLTGFLGSGKTTLLNALLTHAAMSDTAVVVNEFGDIGIDNALVESVDGDIVVMTSGCLCCTIQGDLVNTLKRLCSRMDEKSIPPFRRVVIETTGLADPAPVLHTLMSDPFLLQRFRLDGVVTTVDAVNGGQTLDNHIESVKQAAVADRLVITKSDLLGDSQDSNLPQRLADLNPAAPLFTAVKGDIAPDRLFDAGLYDPETKSLDVRRWLRDEAYSETQHDHGHDHDDDHNHGHDRNRHDASIRAFCIYLDKPLSWNIVATWLELLTSYRGADLLRVKGLLNVEESEKPVVIHGVQHVFHPPAMLAQWPDEDRRSRIVFIAKDVGQEQVLGMLTALTERDINVTFA